jgi:hypothetical protein
LKADRFLTSHVYHDVPLKEVANLNWNIALVNHSYEQGFPHTRDQIIFISPEIVNKRIEELTKTLVHEKIHIYQRKNPELMKLILYKMGFKPHTMRKNIPCIRANPDVNEFVYLRKGRPMFNCYASLSPKGINDVRLEDQPEDEHPFEMMAYHIANAYTSK